MPGDEAATPGRPSTWRSSTVHCRIGRLTRVEAEDLATTAKAWAMTRSDVLDAHRAYLASLASEALMTLVYPLRNGGTWRRSVTCSGSIGPRSMFSCRRLTERSPQREPLAAADLRGKSVCFTGELLGRLRGERVTREVAEGLATESGLEVRASVTKRLDLLVVADPETQSIKARKAREYGVRIMAERVFWKGLGVAIE